jgi:hypothetical protein
MADVAITRSPDFHDCGLVIVATVTNQCPRCNRYASDSCPTLRTLKCRPSVHRKCPKMCHGFPTDVPLSHAESPPMPRIESPVTTQGSRKDHARFTQGATHNSQKEHARFMERVCVVHSASITLATHWLFDFPALVVNVVRIEETPWPPILYVWVTDMTRDPYHPTVGFLSARRSPFGSGVDNC